MGNPVSWGLFLAWLANDVEEWFTMSSWSKRNAQRRGESATVWEGEAAVDGAGNANESEAANPGGTTTGSGVPVWLRQEVSQAHARTAIVLMGAVILAASARGARTGGRSPFFQSALFGFGVHGVGHLALTALHRGYTPGVATAPTIVLPYSLWAWRRLGRAGVRRDDTRTWVSGAVMLPLTLGGVHGAAHLLTRWAAKRRAVRTSAA
ncbi:HXXEE domain-containing protein [Saccharopolyspora erythraea]|nr:HXXEE domain-containing protein [Saccharopolyspora erythraea]